MYGTRDAALNWSMEYTGTLQAAGYVQGKLNPCLFYNDKLDTAIMVHGDYVVGIGSEKNLEALRKTLTDKYKTKVDTFAPANRHVK